MICDLGQESFQQAHAPMYDTLESDSKRPLYLRCKNSLTLLLAVLSLVNVKARYRWGGQKFHFTVSGTTRHASKGKHDAKKLLLGEEDIMYDGYEVSENTCMP